MDGDSLDPTVGPVEPEHDAAQSAASSRPAETSGSTFSGLRWARRKFLGAAALGSAAAALLSTEGGSLSFGPLAALAATNFTTASCTANDQNVGIGTVFNPPCQGACTGTFDAIVQFPVQNGTNTGRYCIALHLFQQTVAGVTIPEQDVLLYNTAACAQSGGKSGGCTSTSSAKATIPMYGVVTGFPCSVSQVSFPNAVVYWQTSTGFATCSAPDTKFPSGQCERQTITINQFDVTMACTAGCPATCGGSITLTATGTATAAQAPYYFSLYQGQDTTGTLLQGPTQSSSLTFAFNPVTPPVGTTYYTVKFADTNGCFRTFTTSVSSSALPTPALQVTAGPDCSGLTTIAVTNASSFPSGVSYAWTDTNGGNTTTLSGSGSSITAALPAGTNSIGVTVSNSAGCTESASINVAVNPPVGVNLTISGQSNCNGQLTFTAAGTGGNGSYTYAWKIGGVTQSNTSNTLLYTNLDGACHTVSVVATDTSANLCSSAPASATVVQCVTSNVTANATCPGGA